MKKLRSFLYLDNYKMYSFSSQLFEGLTEYIVESHASKVSSEASQKGKIGSGRIIGDIIENNSSHSEKKFLHDYSYYLFEEALVAQNRVLSISAENYHENIDKISDYSFVKISGKVIFNDAKILEETIKNYNEFGEAVGYLQFHNQIKRVQNAAEDVKNITDRNHKAKAKTIINKEDNAFKQLLIENNLKLDEVFLKSLAYIVDYGYNKQFEIQIPILDKDNSHALFSAQLIRENLKDNEYNIIKKYSRESEKEFKLFGILTQRLGKADRKNQFTNFREKLNQQKNDTDSSMKEAIFEIIEKMSDLENVFIGKLDYEYVIDPIALYMEI